MYFGIPIGKAVPTISYSQKTNLVNPLENTRIDEPHLAVRIGIRVHRYEIINCSAGVTESIQSIRRVPYPAWEWTIEVLPYTLTNATNMTGVVFRIHT